jgi:hypothetical protein
MVTTIFSYLAASLPVFSLYNGFKFRIWQKYGVDSCVLIPNRYVDRQKDVLKARTNRTTLVRFLGHNVVPYAWCTNNNLLPYEHPGKEHKLEELRLYGARKKSEEDHVAQALYEAEHGIGELPWELSSDDEEARPPAGAEVDFDNAANKEAPASGAPTAGATAQLGAGTKKAVKASNAVDPTVKEGLTPDWIIDAGCAAFQLPERTLEQPLIKGKYL